VAEVAALRVVDVDFIRGVVHPKQQWADKPLKTPGSDQPIPIPQDLALLLSASVKAYPSEMMVTNGPGTDRCGPWIIERAIRDARDKIDGLPEGFSFHDLRHYLASLLIASGADIKTVQARMRHASARTTLDTYGHLVAGCRRVHPLGDRCGNCRVGGLGRIYCVPTAYRGGRLAASPQVRALAGLDVEVERELRPGRLLMFAGLGTLGRTTLDLQKCFSGSLAGIGIARRSCGRPAGAARRAGEVKAGIAAVPAADVSRPAGWHKWHN
jgi:hypothetical protein